MPAYSVKKGKNSVHVSQQGNLNLLIYPTSHPTKKLVNIVKKTKTQRESLILGIFCKEEDTEIYCSEHQSLPPDPISGHGSKGVACVRVGDKVGELE